MEMNLQPSRLLHTMTWLMLIFCLTACATPTKNNIGSIVAFPFQTGGQHTASADERVQYETTPPVSGKHAGIWQNCGEYQSEIRNETAVHSMEHGAVWITYQPGLPPKSLQKLRDLIKNKPNILLSPLAIQTEPIIASAWTVQLRLMNADVPKLRQFLERYSYLYAEHHESRAPEVGSACVGGFGQPKV
jgi:Protein of unknown function (DUF3105)